LRTLRNGLLGLCALMSIARAASAQDARPTIAVLHVDAVVIGQKNTQDMSTVLADMITTEMAKKPNVRVIDRLQMQDILTKKKLDVSGRLSDEDAMRAAKLLTADYFIIGSAAFVGPTVRMDLRISETETSVIHKTFKQSGKQEDLLAIVDQLVENFTTDLKVPVIAHNDVAEVPASAVLAYSRGLDFEKRGKKTQAAQMYEKTLQISPSYDEAQKALARVK
jgi:TolB-like protein